MYADWMKIISLNVTLEDIKEWKRRKNLREKTTSNLDIRIDKYFRNL